MSSLSQFLASTSPKAITAAGPGSNGYWRREMFFRSGAFSFTVKKSGRIKIYAGGAAGGGGRLYPGSSAGMSCDERDYVAGDVITVTIGAGGIGGMWSVDGGNGGSTTVVCAARGLNLVLTGAIGGRDGGAGMTAGTAAGGNLFNRNGAAPAAAGANQGFGGPSSASPFGVGVASASNGGAGWGGPARGPGGASSHRASVTQEGADGGLSKGGFGTAGATYPRSDNGESQPWWDLVDFDGGGGSNWNNPSGTVGSGGVGSGGGFNGSSGSGSGGNGGIGGGGGAAGSARGGDGGNCAGGGASSSSGGPVGGKGGDGLCIIYWDEVQL